MGGAGQVTWSGGVARPKRITGITTTGAKYYLNESAQPHMRGTTKWLRIKNLGAQTLQVFFTEEAFTDHATTDYAELPANNTTNMDHVLELPIEASEIWLKSGATTTSAEVVAVFR